MQNDELRAVTTRVKELRQELESVEARLRELAGDGASLEPIEPMDSPTVLTTNHAQRRAQTDRLMRSSRPPPPPAPVETAPVTSVTPPIAPASASVSAPPTASAIPVRRAAAPIRTAPIDHGF